MHPADSSGLLADLFFKINKENCTFNTKIKSNFCLDPMMSVDRFSVSSISTEESQNSALTLANSQTQNTTEQVSTGQNPARYEQQLVQAICL